VPGGGAAGGLRPAVLLLGGLLAVDRDRQEVLAGESEVLRAVLEVGAAAGLVRPDQVDPAFPVPDDVRIGAGDLLDPALADDRLCLPEAVDQPPNLLERYHRNPPFLLDSIIILCYLVPFVKWLEEKFGFDFRRSGMVWVEGR